MKEITYEQQKVLQTKFEKGNVRDNKYNMHSR